MSDDECTSTTEAETSTSSKPKASCSRGERKARRLLLKNNEKSIENVSRVVLRQSDGTLYVIDSPEVYKQANTFIVFGQICDGNLKMNQMQTEQAAMKIHTNIAAAAAAVKAPAKKERCSDEEENGDGNENDDEDDDDDGEGTEIDEIGLEGLDIELVMNQANVSRRKAVIALKKNDNDLVNTIMYLTQ